MNKKILILTAHFGLGHIMATEGLKNAFDEKKIPYTVMDIVESGGLLEKESSRLYEKFMKSGRFILRLIYPNKYTSNALTREIYRKIYIEKYSEKIAEINPDVIVATHHIATLVATLYKKSNKNVSVYSVITDYVVHPLWIWEHVEKYFVGLEATKQEAMTYGANENKVYVTGIPLRKPFWHSQSKKVIRDKLSLPQDKFIILISAGSYDSTSISPILSYLVNHKNAYPIVLTGKKEESYKKYTQMMEDLHLEGKVYPFIDFIADVMAASDIFITKAGGLSIAEGMSSGLAMIFLDSIPGQEEGNASLLKKLGAGIPVNGTTEATRELKELIENPDKLKKIQENALAYSHPDSSLQIIHTILEDEEK